MSKSEKVTPIRTEENRARGERDGSLPGQSEEKSSRQGISNRDVQEETKRQAKVVPFREEANTERRKKPGRAGTASETSDVPELRNERRKT